MNANYDFVVDFARPSKANTLIVSENDDRSRTLHFVLLANNQPLDMSDVKTAIINATIPDKTQIVSEVVDILKTTDSSGNEINLNEISYTISRDITQVAGRVTATITLVAEDGKTITSFEFYIEIRNKLYTEDDYVSDGTKTNLMDLISRAQDSINRINEKWKEIVETGSGNALPTPFPLIIKNDAGDQNFTGAETRTVDLRKVSYWSDNALKEDFTLDDSFVGNISQLRTEMIGLKNSCESYANAASRADAAAVTAQIEASKAVAAADRAEKYNPTEVEVESLMEGGRQIATITVNGQPTDIYAPYGGGSGEGGTSFYDELQNLPSINGVTLVGDKSTEDLGIEMPDLTGYATTDWVAGYAQKKLVKGDYIDIDEEGRISAEQTEVLVHQVQQPGTNSSKIATITVNGQPTDIYAPKSSSGSGEVVVNSNYNDLDNRPSFEGKVLEGNLSKSFFGIPTATSQLTNDSHVAIDRTADSTSSTPTVLTDGGTFTTSTSTHDRYGHSTGYVATQFKLPSYATQFNAKADASALNLVSNRVTALEGTVLEQTMAVGTTTITFADEAITSDSMIDIYTDKYGLNPSSVTVNAGSMTIVFAAQTVPVAVKVIVR